MGRVERLRRAVPRRPPGEDRRGHAEQPPGERAIGGPVRGPGISRESPPVRGLAVQLPPVPHEGAALHFRVHLDDVLRLLDRCDLAVAGVARHRPDLRPGAEDDGGLSRALHRGDPRRSNRRAPDAPRDPRPPGPGSRGGRPPAAFPRGEEEEGRPVALPVRRSALGVGGAEDCPRRDRQAAAAVPRRPESPGRPAPLPFLRRAAGSRGRLGDAGGPQPGAGDEGEGPLPSRCNVELVLPVGNAPLTSETSPIALAGDSFNNGLEANLSHRLNLPIRDLHASGSSSPFKDLLRDPESLKSMKVLIYLVSTPGLWEYPAKLPGEIGKFAEAPAGK